MGKNTPTRDHVRSFRGVRLLETISHSAHPEFAVWHWLNIVQDNPVKFVTARLWPPPTTGVPEELRFRRRRDRKSKAGATGNTGPSAAVSSTIRSFEVLPADGCAWYPEGVDHSPGFLVRDPGEFHWRAINQSRDIVSGEAAQGMFGGLSNAELREKRKLTSGYSDKGESPLNFWQGDDDPADIKTDGAPFNPDTPRTFKRGRRRYETDEEDFQKREAWEETRKKCEAILEAGRAWSPMDPREDDRILPSGAKYNLSNRLFKRMEYEIDLHWENFDSRKKLFAEHGLEWETERKRELEEVNMKKECPNTPFTAAQIKDIVAHDGLVAYVHAVTDKPRWYRLDMDRFETYQEAIEDVKRRGKDRALKESKMWNNPRAPKAKFNLALREVVVRWDEYFRNENIYIADWRNPTVVAITEEAWRADAA